ncbi:MAG: glycosyltransferase family 39 protein [Pseudomonadales bacterium]|nr:glycosyltransferase family 39 protein [Pseudomonadales bacterium]
MNDIRTNANLLRFFPYVINHHASLFIFAVLGIILRAQPALYTDFSLDEFWSAEFSRPDKNVADVVKDTLHDVHPPLFQFLLHYWFKAFGYTEWVGRSFSLLMGILTFPVIYQLAKELYDKETAKLAFILFILSPFAIFYSAEMRNYELLLLLSAISTWQCIKLFKAPSLLTATLYFIASLALAYTHYFGVILIMTQGLCILVAWHQHSRKNKTIFFIFLVIYVVLCLSYIPMIEYVLSDMKEENFWVSNLSWYWSISNFLIFFGIPTGIIPAIIYSFMFWSTRQKLGKREYLILLNIILAITIPFILGLIVQPILTARNLIIILPIVILLFSQTLQHFGPKVKVAAIAVLLLNALASTVFFNQIKGEDLERLLATAHSDKLPLYIVNADGWKTDRFVKIKHELNIARFPALKIETFTTEASSLPDAFWLACYHRCHDIKLDDFIPTDFQVVGTSYGKGYQGKKLVKFDSEKRIQKSLALHASRQ